MATQSLAFTFIYACYMLSGRKSDVAAPRKRVYKKQGRLPKGLHGVLVDRGAGGGKAIQGKVIPKRINKSTWCTLSLGPGSGQKGGAVVIFIYFF